MLTSRLMRLHSERNTLADAELSRTKRVSSLHFLKLVEDDGEVGFWTKDFRTDTGTCSAGVYRMLGIDTASRIEHIDLLEMMHPDDLRVQEDFEAGLRHGRPMHVEYRIIRPDGQVRWFDDRAEVLLDAKGNPTSALGVLRDVTEIRELKQSLVRGRARRHAITELLGAIEFGLDASGRIISRQGWTKLTGQKIREAEGWGWLEMLPADRRDDARQAWGEALTNLSALVLETDIRCDDGQYRSYRIKVVPLRGGDGLVHEWAGVIVPIDAPSSNNGDVQTVRDCFTGPHLRAARAMLNWSREDLAQAAGVSISSIRRLESGDTRVLRQKTIEAVSQTLRSRGIVV